MIVDLKEVGRADGARVGGKGASLGEMLRAGVTLPPGFVVEAAAYRAAVEAAGLWPAIEAALAAPGVAEGEAAACEAASERIRPLFEAAWLPELDAEVGARVATLGPVAVRSSATAEDLPDASFAGQQETFLGVRGSEAARDAVRRCWASLWTARAISYRARQGYDHAEVALAVVVQQMVVPEVAGVLFTIDPVSGRTDEMLLNASWGLGEAVVSGMVTPDTWRLGRSGTLVRETRIGAKERRIDAVEPGGTETREVPLAERARPCLDEAALRALVALGERVEAWYGGPQDIEFAWTGGKAVLLQARPVTTRVATPPTYSATQRRTLDDILEHYPAPPLPLDEVAIVDGYEALQAMLRLSGAGFPHAREIFTVDDDGVYRVRPPPLRLTAKILGLPGALAAGWRADPDAWAPAVAQAEAAVHHRAPPALDDAGLAAQLRAALNLAAHIARVRFTQVILPMALRGVWLTALSRVARHPVDPFDWLGGLSFKTVEVERGLQVVADAALAAPGAREVYLTRPPAEVRAALAATPGGDAVLEAITTFLGEHGARTSRVYVPFSTRSWAEDDTPLHALVAAMVRAGEVDAAQTRAKAAAARHEAERERVRARLPGFLRGTFLRTLDAYRRAHVGREATLYAIERAFVAARAAADEAGRRLAARGVLGAGSHVVYARLAEVEDALSGKPGNLRSVVGRRRARRELAVATWRSQRAPPKVSAGVAVAGVPGSPGVAEGPVRVVHGVADFGRLQAGDVLVCPYTDPTWTPLFGLAAAVVADTGGPLSHAAIVAREYGIPAVLGTEAGTTTLQEGERVVVDGAAGTVRRVAAG